MTHEDGARGVVSGGARFDLSEARALLANTPKALDGWLRDLPAAWLECDEGPETWNALIVLGHLIEGEHSDWMPRVEHLLEHGEQVPFPPFDRFAQLRRPHRSVAALLDEFAALRRHSLDRLVGLRLSAGDLQRRGRHPEFGAVTLGQHLATWVAHDLSHLTQIARVMARRYAAAVGPWRAYLRVVRDA
jgi:hypothetical protein